VALHTTALAAPHIRGQGVLVTLVLEVRDTLAQVALHTMVPVALYIVVQVALHIVVRVAPHMMARVGLVILARADRVIQAQEALEEIVREFVDNKKSYLALISLYCGH
jgi:hypothetical protein